MNKVTVYSNQFDSSESRTFESADILRDYYTIAEQKPHARLYVNDVSQSNDITPCNKISDDHVYALAAENKEFFIVERAALDWAFSTWLAWEAINYTNDLIIDALMPDIPNQEAQKQASNNALGDRGNAQRLGQRAPDIFGQVRAYPDLIYSVYKYFENRREVEESVMCLGRGKYEIEAIKEADTSIEQIVGTSVSIYAPNESIFAADHQYRYGDKFDDLPPVAKKSASITGQTAIASSSERLNRSDIYFEYPNKITSSTADGRRVIAEAFEDGEQVIVAGALFGVAAATISGSATVNTAFQINVVSDVQIPAYSTFTKMRINAFWVNDATSGGLDLAGEYRVSRIVESMNASKFVYAIQLDSPAVINPDFNKITAATTATISGQLLDSSTGIDLGGTYTVASRDTGMGLYLATPSAVNTDWLELQQVPNMNTANSKAEISLWGSQDNYVGWFESYDLLTTESWYNFYAQNGIYEQNKHGSPIAKNIEVQVEVQQIDEAGEPQGAVIVKKGTVAGEDARDAVGLTIRIQHEFLGPFRFRVKRISAASTSSQVVDDVKIREVYAVYYAEKHVYDDETIVRTRTIATESALSTKERKLNMLATRLLKIWRNGLWIEDQPTKNVADILIAVAMDHKIGRRKEHEIDVQGIHDEVQRGIDYFGTEEAMEFSYTFDSLNQSFQEACFAICEPSHLTPSRSGNKLQVSFESSEDLPVLLFNFRNKLPKTHNKINTYGITDNHDGVILKWIDPKNGDIETSMYVPDENILNPKTLSFVGIRNKTQAHFIAWRAWHKLKYVKKSVEFQALREADLLARKDLILLVDNRNQKYQGGEILAQNGLELTLSHNVKIDANKAYVIHLQLADASVDAIAITSKVGKNKVLIERAPSLPLVISDDEDFYQFNTLYEIAEDDGQVGMLYRVDSKSPASKSSSTLNVSNFDLRVYEHDQDYINDLI